MVGNIQNLFIQDEEDAWTLAEELVQGLDYYRKKFAAYAKEGVDSYGKGLLDED